GADAVGDGGAEDEAAALDADDDVDALILERYRQAVDRGMQTRRVLEQRRDVVEENAGFREIGNVSNLALEVVHVHDVEKPVSRPVGGSESTSTSATRAPRGPWRSARSKRSSASASPSACASTRPSGRLRTQPWTPSRSAASCAKKRKPTPWTRPLIRKRRATRTRDDTGWWRPRQGGKAEGGNAEIQGRKVGRRRLEGRGLQGRKGRKGRKAEGREGEIRGAASKTWQNLQQRLAAKYAIPSSLPAFQPSRDHPAGLTNVKPS